MPLGCQAGMIPLALQYCGGISHERMPARSCVLHVEETRKPDVALYFYMRARPPARSCVLCVQETKKPDKYCDDRVLIVHADARALGADFWTEHCPQARGAAARRGKGAAGAGSGKACDACLAPPGSESTGRPKLGSAVHWRATGMGCRGLHLA